MSKLKIIFFIFIVFFILIIVRLFYLQVIASYSTSESSYLNYNRITPQRGFVFDRNGKPLVLNQPSFRLFVEPKKIKNKKDLIEKVDQVLAIGEATLEAKIDQTKDWVAIQSGLTEEQKNKIVRQKINGIGFEDNSQRYYPESSLAAHLLGFVGKNKTGENIGYFGVEGFYDQDLIGLSGLMRLERDLFGRPILLGNQEKIESENGRNLTLTIDSSVQKIVKAKLTEGMERYKAKEGCVIVADPNTLEILAMSCLPDFDPDKYYQFNQEIFVNQAISSLYEPGSTFKPMIMAAAINEKKLKPDDLFDEEGPITIGEYKVRTWDDKYSGKITMTRILEKSSNVGMVYVGKKLGNDNIYKYLNKYGFGALTKIDLQGEVGGYLRPQSQWYPIDYATTTFGQGIAVTPIQMIKAFSSLINGGLVMRPHVVKTIDSGSDKKDIGSIVESRIIDKKTSEIIKKMLESTVQHGEYKWTIPKGYRVGGKTGTAQIPLQGHYDSSKTIASFIGFAPVENPKFIALVILKEPGTSIYGSETAAPLFFEIAKELFVYYNIAPEQ